MKVSGFTFVRNGVKYDYPFLESINSLLPICDEIVVAVGQSEDDTLERIKLLNSSKIKFLKQNGMNRFAKAEQFFSQQNKSCS